MIKAALKRAVAPTARTLLDLMRRELRVRTAASPRLRRATRFFADELDGALAEGPELYDPRYFGEARDARKAGLSGYAEYTRHSSHANKAAYLIWKHLAATQVLDVGCAKGFLVEALREVGMDARGTDYSQSAIELAAPQVRPHLVQGHLAAGLPFETGQFDLVTAFEILEHLPPARVPDALAELARLTRGWLLATIPSFGPNPSGTGPAGWFEGKVRWSRLDHYKAMGESYDGPIPDYDLLKDRSGTPVEGHLTIASYAWWGRALRRAGLIRCPELETLLHPVLDRFRLSEFWCLYVFRRPEWDAPATPVRGLDDVKSLEERWGLV